MNNQEYIKQAMTTENKDFASIISRLNNNATLRLLHAIAGLSTESNELLNALKAHIFYGKPLDFVNIQEEAGDIFWFSAQLADVCRFTFEDTMEKNLAKLRARYPNKFNELDAVNRELDRERKVLERTPDDLCKGL